MTVPARVIRMKPSRPGRSTETGMAALTTDRRDVDGILLLDKPSGMTSNQALSRVKRCFRARKAGHTGSLDPLATGLLPVCFGEATKVSARLLADNKTYEVCAQLGVVTDTGDADGRVIAERPVPERLDAMRVESLLTAFRGDLMQVPPMMSALKHNGKRLYQLARAGVVVERPARPVRIDRLVCLGVESDRLWLEVGCSKGTYVRSLVEDIGAAMGCGAHVRTLRRTRIGDLDLARAVTLEAIERAALPGDDSLLQALLRPADSALSGWPAVTLADASVRRYLHGQSVVLAVPEAPVGDVRVYGSDSGAGCFLGTGRLDPGGRLIPVRRIGRWSPDADN